MEPSPKKQKINPKACESCRAKKTKCNMAMPICDTCEKRGTKCMYSERSQPGLRPGFGKSLEDRLGRIEESLDDLRQLIQQGNIVGQPRQPSIRDPFCPYPQGDLPSTSPGRQETTLCAAETDLGVSPLLEDHRSANPPLNLAEGLPPQHILHQLSALYFEFAHPWTNIYSRVDIEADISSLPNDGLTRLHAITLCGFKYWTQEEPNALDRHAYMENSRDRLMAAAINQVSIPCAEALVILALDAAGCGPSSRTLNVMSLLSTAITELDLPIYSQQSLGENPKKVPRMIQNRLPESTEEQNPVHDLSQQSNIFWKAYVMDRIVGVSHGIRCKIAPNFFSRTQLTDEEISMPSSRIKALVHDVHYATSTAGVTESWQKLIEIATLIERVNEFILSPTDLSDAAQCGEWKNHFRILDAALSSWRAYRMNDGLPSGVFDAVGVTSQALYHTAIIRLHSVAAFPPRTGCLITPSPIAPGRCNQAVQSIRDICQALTPPDFSKLGPLFVFAVWVASRNMITLWTSGWEEQTWVVPSELTTLRDSLRGLAVYWTCAEQFGAMIEFVVESSENTSQPSMLAVFNDLSKTAYGLHNALGSKVRQNRDMQMAQLWECTSIPGFEEMNPFL